YAPAGLSQRVRHVWRQNGKVGEVVELSPVRGRRREGLRTYSRKTAFPADPAGRWTVDVSTSAGQLVGRLSFRVTPSRAGLVVEDVIADTVRTIDYFYLMVPDKPGVGTRILCELLIAC